ncbi:MAG TPA: membrane-bound lytic murein transglycosylase MltF [Steroidobacteraceae bacterium]|nr:membrane-bound lytic murein transglycosylase MltF [Steroidobacteraceae bacterium]
MRSISLAIAVLSFALLGTCQRVPTLLEQIRDLGVLRVVTRNSPTAYFLGANGPEGPEYELADRFAAKLGVALYIYTVPRLAQIKDEITSGRAHLAAAGLSVSHEWQDTIAYGPTYQQIRQHLVYRMGQPKPRDLQSVNGAHLEVIAGSRHAELLKQLRNTMPNLVWVENRRDESLDLLARVANGDIDYTISDSTEFALARALYPEIRVAFDLPDEQPVAWALRRDDTSLATEVHAFFAEATASGALAELVERYFGQNDRFEYVGARDFIAHIGLRLPRYRDWFKEAAASVGEDWRLLAAIGYQESQWNANAISPTGVRGIMMLTEDTARAVGISDRADPRQSILGGARYFISMRDMIPDRIGEPDRTWLALAAYNVGYGHLEDARILTQMRHHNPDSWQDVRAHLPLLAQEKWYLQVKRGYARGWEPVRFVDNVRAYLDVLEWVAQDAAAQPAIAQSN